MSFSSNRGTSRIGETYSQSLHPKTSVSAKNIAIAFKAREVGQVDGTINEVSPDLTEESIRANLEPIKAQTSTLTQRY